MSHQLLQAFESPPLRPTTVHGLDPCLPGIEGNGDNEPPTNRPLSGPGSSRQTRRLQLRNAGFRGPAIAPRKVTPKSESTSTEWSSLSGVGGVSDENISPQGPSFSTGREWSNTGPPDLGASTLTRPKRLHQRRQASRQVGRISPEYDDAYANIRESPTSPRSYIRPRAPKTRVKVSHQRRRSLSAEANRYIEHLEMQLAEAEQQLATATASTSAAGNPSRMRALTVEAQHLQEELDAWEEMYDERVQEEIERHQAVEGALRQQIETMERDTDDMRIRVEELEEEIDATNGKLQSVEGANILLEKRVEMMSELLAASKIDLYAGTPAAHDRRHSRLKSMLPRFPTAKSLNTSPERQIQTQPPSPAMLSPRLAYISVAGNPISPPYRKDSSSEASPRPLCSTSENMSDAESIFSETFTVGDSMTSAEQFDGVSSLNAWGIPVISHPKQKPARRMRKFVGGSVGPKPLILPSTNQHSYFGPVSAPPMERRETSPAFFHTPARKFAETGLDQGRRRSSTTANENMRASLSFSPLMVSPGDIRSPRSEPERPVSADSLASTTTRRPFSMTSPPGRSLMEELSAAWSDGSDRSTESGEGGYVMMEQKELGVIQIFAEKGRSRRTSMAVDLTIGPSASLTLENTSVEPVVVESVVISDGADSASATSIIEGLPDDTTSNLHDTGPGLVKPASPAHLPQRSIFERMRLLFGDLCRSPVVLARHLVQTAQARMRIPEPLRNVQWWLVGILLGPLAKRRMLATTNCCTRPPDNGSPRNLDNNGSIYELDASPTTCDAIDPDDTGQGNVATIRPRKCRVIRPPCHCHRHPHPPPLSKHSPWLWLKFSLTLAFAIGTAFRDGPGSLLRQSVCACRTGRLGEGGQKMVKAA